MGTYLPVSISNGRIPVLNCDIRERRRRDIYILDNIWFWFKYILKHYVRPQFRRFFSIVDFHLIT